MCVCVYICICKYTYTYIYVCFSNAPPPSLPVVSSSSLGSSQ